ncbi:hypothetical protein A8V01_05545 [Novosphingobium guangzhouense]|uniref:Uncharacterized protein n=2 Tax=Novosphingobium guangzhouense TaxID=1850347 RepID=A0A2K2FZ82_9SPHN|nr:hypothetical protein A8V01_05545 [Novosphingobium guangzhouense]
MPGLVRIIWFVSWLAVAMAAAGFEFDRASKRNSGLARYVPSMFRGAAFEATANAAYARGANDEGVRLAREMVLRRPIPAEGLSLVALGALRNGDDDKALKALLLSAARGWRDSFTQATVARLAMNGGEWEVAAQRIMAMWRKGDTGDELNRLTTELLAQPEGLAAFQFLVGREAAWTNPLLRLAAVTLSPKAMASLAATFRDRGASINCPGLTDTAGAIIRAGYGPTIEALWSGACGLQGQAAKRNAGFVNGDDDASGPFGWKYPVAAALSREFVEHEGVSAIRYENSDPFQKVVASRYALMRPGAHDIVFNGRVEGASPKFQVICFVQEKQIKFAEFTIGSQATRINIPIGCESQLIKIQAGRGRGELAAVQMSME